MGRADRLLPAAFTTGLEIQQNHRCLIFSMSVKRGKDQCDNSSMKTNLSVPPCYNGSFPVLPIFNGSGFRQSCAAQHLHQPRPLTVFASKPKEMIEQLCHWMQKVLEANLGSVDNFINDVFVSY